MNKRLFQLCVLSCILFIQKSSSIFQSCDRLKSGTSAAQKKKKTHLGQVFQYVTSFETYYLFFFSLTKLLLFWLQPWGHSNTSVVHMHDQRKVIRYKKCLFSRKWSFLGHPLGKTLWLHASSVSQSVCQTFSIHFLHHSYLFLMQRWIRFIFGVFMPYNVGNIMQVDMLG